MKQELINFWYLFWGMIFNIQSWQYKGQGYTDRQARAKEIRSKLKRSEKMRIFRQDNFTCVYCNWQDFTRTGTGLELDHMTPIGVGKDGTNHPANLITACRSCNRSKGAKVL